MDMSAALITRLLQIIKLFLLLRFVSVAQSHILLGDVQIYVSGFDRFCQEHTYNASAMMQPG